MGREKKPFASRGPPINRVPFSPDPTIFIIHFYSLVVRKGPLTCDCHTNSFSKKGCLVFVEGSFVGLTWAGATPPSLSVNIFSMRAKSIFIFVLLGPVHKPAFLYVTLCHERTGRRTVKPYSYNINKNMAYLQRGTTFTFLQPMISKTFHQENLLLLTRYKVKIEMYEYCNCTVVYKKPSQVS